MELDTSSWDETIMMGFAERILEMKQTVLRNPLLEAAASAWAAASAPCDRAEEIHSLREELSALRGEQLKLQQAIFEAAQIQRRLCAPRELSWGEFEIAGEIFPVRHLSGDFFKVMELGTELGLALGDIAGKGLTAGIWQAHLMALIQRSARTHSDPAYVVAEVNRELCHDEGAPPLTALFFARIDPVRSELVYCNAGLPAPLLLRDNKRTEHLKEGGPILGALKNAPYCTGRVVLNAGDALVAYSDGVTECRNAQDDEFEVERLAAAARAVIGVSANKALFSLLGTVLDFADSCSPRDDLTLLVVRRRVAAKTEPTRASSSSKDFSSLTGGRNRRRGRRTPSGEETVPDS
jgi:sigma-B regulation protein RsbU (phosphoserine phosphatase)